MPKEQGSPNVQAQMTISRNQRTGSKVRDMGMGISFPQVPVQNQPYASLPSRPLQDNPQQMYASLPSQQQMQQYQAQAQAQHAQAQAQAHQTQIQAQAQAQAQAQHAMRPPIIHPPSSAQLPGGASELQVLFDELHQLRNRNASVEELNEVYRKMSTYPPYLLHAGGQLYPHRKPFNSTIRLELLESSNNNATFGTTNQGEAQAAFQTDAANPSFLQFITFGMYRTAGAAPLNTYLPLGGVDAAGNTGLDFIWKAVSTSDERKWQTDWRDSIDLMGDSRRGYVLPVEYEMWRDDKIIITAAPLGNTPADTTYRLFCTLHFYKMWEIQQTVPNGAYVYP